MFVTSAARVAPRIVSIDFSLSADPIYATKFDDLKVIKFRQLLHNSREN